MDYKDRVAYNNSKSIFIQRFEAKRFGKGYSTQVSKYIIIDLEHGTNQSLPAPSRRNEYIFTRTIRLVSKRNVELQKAILMASREFTLKMRSESIELKRSK